MYHMFFGGHIIVFASWANMTSEEEGKKWKGITWSRASCLILYGMVCGHAAWFWTWGYHEHFVILPCGTTHFFFGPVSENNFGILRMLLILMFWSGALELGIVSPPFPSPFHW